VAQFANAQEAMGFVQDRTKAINATVYAVEYPEHDFASLVPTDTSAPEWSTGMITYLTDYTGAAQWINGMSKDIPLADLQRGQSTVDFAMAGIGYDFNLEEINHAALQGIPLTTSKADAARELSMQKLYNVALYGDPLKGMTGLLNSTAVTAGLVAQNAAADSRLWSAKTPTEVLKDINDLLTGVYIDSNTVEMADTLLLSPERLQYLGSTTMSSTNSETLLAFIMRTNIYKLTTGLELTIRAVRGLSTAGAGGTQRMCAYRRTERTVVFHLPMSPRFLPVWQNGPMNFLVPGIFRTGGTEIRRSGSVRYADGF